jgi:hypothetical protein
MYGMYNVPSKKALNTTQVQYILKGRYCMIQYQKDLKEVMSIMLKLNCGSRDHFFFPDYPKIPLIYQDDNTHTTVLKMAVEGCMCVLLNPIADSIVFQNPAVLLDFHFEVR